MIIKEVYGENLKQQKGSVFTHYTTIEIENLEANLEYKGLISRTYFKNKCDGFYVPTHFVITIEINRTIQINM